MIVGKLEKLPLYGGKKLQDEAERRTWQICVEQGRFARKRGDKLKTCPPFRNPDMTASWRIGWHDEDDRLKRIIAERTAKGTCRRRARAR